MGSPSPSPLGTSDVKPSATRSGHRPVRSTTLSSSPSASQKGAGSRFSSRMDHRSIPLAVFMPIFLARRSSTAPVSIHAFIGLCFTCRRYSPMNLSTEGSGTDSYRLLMGFHATRITASISATFVAYSPFGFFTICGAASPDPRIQRYTIHGVASQASLIHCFHARTLARSSAHALACAAASSASASRFKSAPVHSTSAGGMATPSNRLCSRCSVVSPLRADR